MSENRSNQHHQHYHQSNQKLDPSLAQGCANYVDEIGKRVMILQKDGKIIVGTLGSLDQYGNLFLYNAYERIFIGGQNGQYGDLSVGAVLIRGDSLAVKCDIDEGSEKQLRMKKVPAEVILKAQQEENKRVAAKEEKLVKGLKERGINYVGRGNTFTDD